ncbi:MAG: hypothetical protein NVSMB53_17510 [Gemmatimonadaceae bacterium]
MNATDTFIGEYTSAVTAGAKVAPLALADACCKLVRQLKTDGFQVEQMIAYVNEQMAEAGGKKLGTEHLDHDLSVHCVGEYFRLTLNAPT